MTNPNVWHESDLIRGLNDFRENRHTPHGDAFAVFVCAALYSLLRIEQAHYAEK